MAGHSSQCAQCVLIGGRHRWPFCPTHLVVPPSMEKQATQLLERELTIDSDGGHGQQ
ncbi:Mu-like prophage major head subunit gpT family protein [Erwinia tracheiphila]|uniref:Mu-like prophage major head subunit gpT family protein n=1 Tax=Erwinia tracheiphila TaxID=65700 RepID=UPI001F1892E7|nr:Mu-like prophage major head subunit gpT family protein [Erwinia tracheiphila]UIA93058.1 Mu-like prophage major head subunit gpT family protein [Erwinia tracheiphila]